MPIAPTARVDPHASIAADVSIGEYCVIEPDVAIGAGCRLEPYVYVKRWTTLGEANQISAGTSEDARRTRGLRERRVMQELLSACAQGPGTQQYTWGFAH